MFLSLNDISRTIHLHIDDIDCDRWLKPVKFQRVQLSM